MAPSISLIIPTRERASYLKHSIRTCTDNGCPDLEILVLNNASNDNTDEVMQGVSDPRVRYVRNESRLSMRDNFEKGIELSRGEILCFIGDDDGLFPFSVETALRLFSRHEVDAVSASRAHYFWPDLLAARKGTALIPRESGVSVHDSISTLRGVLTDCDYYRLPCLYQGFVRRSIVERIKRRQGRFFLSSQVDMFSSIALSMEGIRFAFSRAPLVINGASSRSNGASHFGGGSAKEKSLWSIEDELGFLPGFTDSMTVGSLIIESALRYCNANHLNDLFKVFNSVDVLNALAAERFERIKAGRDADEIRKLYETVRVGFPESKESSQSGRLSKSRATRLIRAFKDSLPVDLAANGVSNVHEAAQYMCSLICEGRTGLLSNLVEQLTTAVRLARG